MAYCGRSAPSSPSRNYECMRKGIGVGRNVKLPRGYVPESINPREDLYCGEKKRSPFGKHKGDPLECFRKGFGIGKKLQYGERKYRGRENFIGELLGVDKEDIQHTSRTFLLAFLVMLIVFGLLFMVEVYWAWSLLISFIAGALFWYFCAI
jgi:hypothetical protein